eukprot:Colp12_sorted_trinity150504_noHs@12243
MDILPTADPLLGHSASKKSWTSMLSPSTALSAVRSIRLDRETLASIPWRNIGVSLLPFLGYLLVFKMYGFLRRTTGLGDTIQVNMTFLPWLEQTLFRCYPHRVLSAYTSTFLDILAAIPYLIHFVLPFMFVGYLYTKPNRRQDIFYFLWIAGWVNFLAVIVQFFSPTGPPWFVDTAVFDSDGQLIYAQDNEAGFKRLDNLMGYPLFHNIYAQSPVKFGAFPSLHVAWPVCILVCKPWISFRFGVIHCIWITWASMYANHHYLVDGCGGFLLVVFVWFCTYRVWNPFTEQKTSSLTVDTRGDWREAGRAKSPKRGPMMA